MSTADKFTKLPKVELHLHADGACRLDTLIDLARQYNVQEDGKCLPCDNVEQFKECVALPHGAKSLSDFLKVFHYLDLILRTKEALERIAYEFCEDCKRHNVLYAEYRYNPFPLSDVPGSPMGADYCDAIISGLERGQKEFGVTVRSIICFMRSKPDLVEKCLELAKQFKSRGVVGVDMAGDELLPLDPRHVEGFKKAKELGLRITVHAGESGPAENVKIAIEQLGAERIGHGYHVVDDEAIYQMAKDRGIHFEVCPLSSKATNSTTFEQHAVKRFAKDGVSFSINTDDPGVILSTIDDDFCVANKDIGLTMEQLKQSVLHAAEASFLPDNEKAKLVEQVKEKLALYETEAASHS